jgi:hypothetical protein
MTDQEILGVDDLDGGAANGRVTVLPAVTFDGKKPVLPDTPATRDHGRQAAWLTSVFNLDVDRPVVRGRHLGAVGGSGIVVLTRYDAPDLEFDPASEAGKPDGLMDVLTWQRAPGDGRPYGWQKPQAQTIGYVVACLCGAYGRRQVADEVVTTLIHTGLAVQFGTTHGTACQRFEAGRALTPELDAHGRPTQLRYLVEEDGEIAIRVSDAKTVARLVHGSLRRGWLDAKFEQYGWQRITLQGYQRGGRDRGAHHRSDIYRGRLPEPEPEPDFERENEGSVNT